MVSRSQEMRSLPLSQASTPVRPATKTSTLLTGDMREKLHLESFAEQRDDLPIVSSSTSSNNKSNSAQSSNIDVVLSKSSSTEQSSASFLNVPFAKTFAVAESYRKVAPVSSPAILPLCTLPRRRARSSEGMTLRHYPSHEDERILQHTAKSASELPVESSLLSPKHLFSPRMSNTQDNGLWQRKPKRKDGSTSYNVTGHANKVTMYSNTNTRQNFRPKHSPKYWISRTKSKYVIPLEHPFKILWDILTVILSITHGYLTHVAIRDRKFGVSPFIAFCDVWFLVDILLNFTTERKTSSGEVLSDHRSIIARYLTSWFAVDALSLVPWEVLYIQPLIELQNRRGILQKSFFRSKAVVRVTRHLRGRHFRWFGTVAKHTKQYGVGGQRLLRLIIKYIPKYWMFFRNMKGVVAIRLFRFLHWSRRFFMNVRFLGGNDSGWGHVAKSSTSDASTISLTTNEGDDDLLLLDDRKDDDDDADSLRKKSVEVLYEDFQLMMMEDDDDDDDEDDYDGVPL
jgi:hypothetical protein